MEDISKDETDNVPVSIFDQWTSACLDLDDSSSNSIQIMSSLPSRLTDAQSAAKHHFEDLFLKDSDNNKNGGQEMEIKYNIIAKQLAQLIAKLGPALSSQNTNSTKMRVRALALNYLLGAIQALQRDNNQQQYEKQNNQHRLCLPFQVVDLLSQFLLEHCGPMQSSSALTLTSAEIMNNHNHNGNGNAFGEDLDGNDNDVPNDDVRDYALLCLNALLKVGIDIESDVSVSVDQCITFRINVAQKAIQRRCATLDDCDDYDDDSDYNDDDDYDDDEGGYGGGGYKEHEREAKMLSNISLLPRAKRSLCFRALEAAVWSIEKDKDIRRSDDDDNIESLKCTDLLVKFSSFAAACLHGETDPRCLMQMLRLMKQVQTTIAPLIQSEGMGGRVRFPYSDIFDSVAVYYPVSFTPPPNDPHGITREGISSALMDVLKCSSCFDSLESDATMASDDKDNDNDNDNNANMTVLATGLFLERISPPSPSDSYGEDDDTQEVSTVRDRIDALEDLKALLLLPSPLNLDLEDEKEQQLQIRILSKLSPKITKEMSDVLYRCHEEAAASVTTVKNDDDMKENKALADSCRYFVTRIAYEFERKDQRAGAGADGGPGSSSLWSVFVKDRVQNLVGTVSSSPQSLKGRMAIAYLASLSACGGERTLRLCMDASIPQLVDLLDGHLQTSDSNLDEEKASTLVYGISVLFSSCRLSMDQITKGGLNIYPHPLRPFGSRIIQMLCKVIGDKTIEDNNLASDLNIAAIKALESVLLSCPANILNNEKEDDTDVVRETILSLARTLVGNIDTHKEDDTKWKLACAQIVGSTIGKSIKGRKEAGSCPSDETLIESDCDIISFVNNVVFPKIMESSITPSAVAQSERYDWMVLGYACETDQKHSVEEIMSSLYTSLVNCIKNTVESETFHNAETIAQAIFYLLNNGGPGAHRAFHSIPPGDESENDLLHILTTNQRDQSGEHAVERMSILLLPGTRDEYRSQADTAVKLSHTILPYILPAYRREVPPGRVETLIHRASQVLPPLSDWDGAELCTIIPVLSVVLGEGASLNSDMLETLIGVLPDLADYVLNRQIVGASRSAAASCLFSIIERYQLKSDECLGLKILKSHVSPVIVNSLDDKSRDALDERMQSLEDAMNVAATIASAASHRGRASALTTDEVTRFLALVACEGAASAPELGISDPLDCAGDSIGNENGRIRSIAASALGSILNVANINPFAKQRLVHLVVPIILSCHHTQNSDMNDNELGCLLCASHVICCINMKALGHQNLSDLACLIVKGLEKSIQILCTNHKSFSVNTTQTHKLITLLLTSLLKMHNQCPFTIIPLLGTIVPTLLLITVFFDNVHTAALNLLSLQILVDLLGHSDEGVLHFCRAYKPKVLKHLVKSLDNPCSQVRQAAVRTKNVWSVFE